MSRLVGMILAAQHGEWQVSRCYFSVESLAGARCRCSLFDNSTIRWAKPEHSTLGPIYYTLDGTELVPALTIAPQAPAGHGAL